MARKIIDIGAVGNDGTGDSIRDSFRKVNDNFRELYSSLGLGEKLTFKGLDDTPTSYAGYENSLLAVNNTETGIQFKQLTAGTGIQLDFTSNTNEITINTLFAEISGDPSPQLGGNLSTRSGATQYRILDLGTTSSPLLPIYQHEAVNKAYADTKISRAGVEAIDPRTGFVNPDFGTMSGPLILSRDPEPTDDEVYDGLIAATKRYVDNSAFGSAVNLYVATSGQDERTGVSEQLQGRALAYAYRTIEAALKRAEELVNESRLDIGPYKKVLTYNEGEFKCTLSSISTAPSSGSGFTGKVYMSADSVTLHTRGTNYRVGDIITLAGGSGSATTLEVLSTISNPGGISTFRVVSSGVYDVLPGNTAVPTISDSEFGVGAKFNVTYKVNNIEIISGGSSYGLVSVRITRGIGDTTGSGAFGTAEVAGGIVQSITITDQGSGFTVLPNVVVDLPRFKIYTGGLRTDFTGDVLSGDPVAARGRDIREGLYLKGETSGALAQILSHNGSLDGGDEIFDVDIKYGTFEIGEEIAYGDVTKTIQISVLIESGIYEENYPLKVPQNVAIIGDEFRRVIVKPKSGESSSPWAFQYFRRDTEIDGLTTAEQLYGYHYLADPTLPVYPMVNNPGHFRSAADLLQLNKVFLQNEITAWINYRVTNNITPFDDTFEYNERLCARDVGLIVDAIAFDLRYGGYNRSVSAALKYKSSASALIAITTQLTQTSAAMVHLNDLAQTIISNTEITEVYNTIKSQTIDLAFVSELGSGAVINELFTAIIDIINNSGSVNYPKNNNDLDVFLCNDANIVRAVTCQGHGGFMMVLDPEGQILAKSPYAQECASFTRSKDMHVFAGGMFIDGFTGNLKFKITEVVTPTFLRVTDLMRLPNLPASFIVNDTVYRVNYVRDFVYGPTGSSASLILDEVTPWPFDVFDYNEDICSRDVGLILDGVGYDIVLGTNYHARKAGFTYREQNAEVVVQDQLTLTLDAIHYAHDLAYAAISGDSVGQAVLRSDETALTTIIENGKTFAPTLTLTNPASLTTNQANAKALLYANIGFIRDETIGWIAAQVAGNISPFTTSFTYNSDRCSRDVQYIIEAVLYDFTYGGNSQSRDAALKYYDGVGDLEVLQLGAGEEDETIAAIGYVKYLAQQVVRNLAPASTYSATPRQTGSAGTLTEATTIGGLIDIVINVVTSGTSAAPSVTYPTLTGYNATALASRTALLAAKTSIQSDTIDYINSLANVYEILMPGNRSMLANDFTQVADMGYGIMVTNGGLLEAVSVFTYYCYISYYALNGGQIRSVSGSSAHGIYALVAEGSDPLEIPTPVSLYYDLSQGASVYFPSALYANTINGLSIYINNFTYVPLGNGELEVIHTDGNLYRYSVNSVDTQDLPTGVAKLNIASTGNSTTAGLAYAVPNGTKVTIRQNSQVVLTGDVVEVATRPSTALKLNETESVYRVLQFEEYTDENGAQVCTITTGNPGVINCTAHGQIAGYIISFSSTGTLPTGITAGTRYFVISEDISENTFKISESRGGIPIEISSAGTGTISFAPYGLARTTLRENYNYIELTPWSPNEFVGATKTFTVTVAAPAVFTSSSHGLASGDVIAFTTTGSLPDGLSITKNYFVLSTGLTTSSFRVSLTPGGDPAETTGTQSGVHSWGKVKGRVGDSNFAIVPIGPEDRNRIVGTKFVWIGVEYTIIQYDAEGVTNEPYARVYLDTPLVNDILTFSSPPSLKAGVPIRTSNASGSLTIRISLTRVTGHDLLEIGTGSYADTNYPNEIYGAAVNPLNPATETAERGSGRTFYVTTDQFGNFNVGPYFRVDQGTGRVTFSAAIALSNLDGIGFKRGVPIAEFSTDSSFSDNATDTVPTENATRIYLERRLGLTHTGEVVPDTQLIPQLTGGFMPLNGNLTMNGDMDLGNNRIKNVDNPVELTDAVNLQSLTLNNLQDFTPGNIAANDFVVFTGSENEITNASVVGDILFDIDSTANTIDAQIQPGVIVNADINASAAIDQSKLNMTAASTRANATGIAQSDLGLASFDNSQFTSTNGWITVSNNGLLVGKIQQIGARTVLGNSSVTTDNVAAVNFSTVVDVGGAIKKSQYNTTGYLRRNNSLSSTLDSDYSVITDATDLTVNTLVKRDSNGDFAARTLTLQDIKLKLSTETSSSLTLARNSTATGGTTRVYAFNGSGGVLIGSGSLTADNTTYYDNNAHSFRTQDGFSAAPISCSRITATQITTGSDTTSGTITGQWILASSPGGTSKGNSRLQATYAADLAEFYEGDKDYEVGTVLVFGGEKEVTTTNTLGDTRVAGVVSDNAAYSMYGACPGFKNQIALQGRVPCKVVGKIKKGDILVTSKIPGVAIAAVGDIKTGSSVGKALQDYDSDHIGTIEVAVGRT